MEEAQSEAHRLRTEAAEILSVRTGEAEAAAAEIVGEAEARGAEIRARATGPPMTNVSARSRKPVRSSRARALTGPRDARRSARRA